MLLGFQKRFERFVLEGSKTHTIRAVRKIGPRVGEICHCYGDVRQKTMHLLGRWRCTAVDEILIKPILVANWKALGMDKPMIIGLNVWINGEELSADEKETLFYRDGFRDVPAGYTSSAIGAGFLARTLHPENCRTHPNIEVLSRSHHPLGLRRCRCAKDEGGEGVSWFSRKPKPSEPLKPGWCECGHARCCHHNGTGRCSVGYPPDSQWPNGAVCACKIYIFDPDDDGEDDEDKSPAPSPEELENLYRR